MCLPLATVIVSLSSGYSAGNPQAETVAVAAAMNWLTGVDGEKHAERWDEAAQFLRDAVQKDLWAQAMQSGRKPFGKNIS